MKPDRPSYPDALLLGGLGLTGLQLGWWLGALLTLAGAL